ncbi:MAG: diaminopimelate decarboxylase [Chloroflexota bacterium]
MILPNHIWPTTATVHTQGHLTIGGCDVVSLAHLHGTPLYVLDAATITEHCQTYREALRHGYSGSSSIHYASKALLNTAVAQMMSAHGLGLDVVSGGELYIALQAGIPAPHLHLHGNAKPRAELEMALEVGIGRIVVDTLDELAVLSQLAASRPSPQSVMLRLAPGINADTHAYIATGHEESKFGLPLTALGAAVDRIVESPGLRLSGLHVHLGSQLFDERPFVQAIDLLLDQAVWLRTTYDITLDAISPGGGIGVSYTTEQQYDIHGWAAQVGRSLEAGCKVRGLPLPQLIIEPGRSIVARAGVALYSVVATKAAPHQPRYLHIDGGMADNIRPALYQARYAALLANRAHERPTEQVHVAGRFCESGDVLLRDAALPCATPGDLLAIASSGAYTLSMASNYNQVPRPALLLVEDGTATVIQRRETYADLIARDVSLPLREKVGG